jgi:hypothetical protein
MQDIVSFFVATEIPRESFRKFEEQKGAIARIGLIDSEHRCGESARVGIVEPILH